MPAPTPATEATPAPASTRGLLPRGLVGGLLMGVANLVPGISGGAMLLILGVYHAFIEAVASLTTLRFKLRHIMILSVIVAGAGTSILLLAGVIRDAVVDYRWQTYSVVAGMRLAAIPIVWVMARRARASAGAPLSLWMGLLAGLLLTAFAAAFTYSPAAQGGAFASGPVMHFAAGLLGASATILPGMDGSYILMLLGQYVPILSAIDRFKDGLLALNTSAMIDASRVLVPTGVGVLLGIGGVSVAMRWLLARAPQPTFGVLLGVLVGAFIGLYPFGTYRTPRPGDTVAGVQVTQAMLDEKPIDKDKWPLTFFRPSGGQVAGSLALVLAGLAAGWLLTKLEGEQEREDKAPQQTRAQSR